MLRGKTGKHWITLPTICHCSAFTFYFYAVKFNFKAELQGLMITFTAERIYRSGQHERYRLWIANSDQFIVIQNNRPAMEAKKGEKPVQWYVVEGHVKDKEALQPVYKKIAETIKNKPAVVQGTFNFIKDL